MYLSKPKQQQEFSILFFARISNNNNNATIYNENTKTRNHETTNFSLVLNSTLSKQKQNKKIKTHNLIFL